MKKAIISICILVIINCTSVLKTTQIEHAKIKSKFIYENPNSKYLNNIEKGNVITGMNKSEVIAAISRIDLDTNIYKNNEFEILNDYYQNYEKVVFGFWVLEEGVYIYDLKYIFLSNKLVEIKKTRTINKTLNRSPYKTLPILPIEKTDGIPNRY